MNYACCYVLTDNINLQLYNQMMISLTSLRHTGFNRDVYIVTDSETALLLESKQNEINELSAVIIIVEIENIYTEKEKSRYLKTSLRKYMQGDILFIDTDTLFISPLPDWISNADFSMVYDRNGLDREYTYRWHKELFDKCGLDIQGKDDRFFNSGIMWIRDTESVHRAFEQWHFLWKKLLDSFGILSDQMPLNYLWKQNIINITELDDRFNVQIAQVYFSPSIFLKAIILHYYNNEQNTPIFMLNDSDIKKLNYHDERIQQIIQEPASAFPDCIWIKKDDITEKYFSTHFYNFGLYMYKKHRRFFLVFEAFCQMLKKIKKVFERKTEAKK